MSRLRCYLSNTKTTVASAFFLAGNYQLQVKSQTPDLLKERKTAKEYGALKLVIILCSFCQSCDSST